MTTPPIDGVRVGDRERAAAVDHLGAHAAAGRLTVEELEQRVERAHAAVVRRDLERLLADLPEPAGRRAVAPRARITFTAFLAAALAATVALSLVAGHPLPPLFLLLLLGRRRRFA